MRFSRDGHRFAGRWGFSLIELLVVIGIIGLLLAILMPVLERGREKANTVRCSSNLRQIGLALENYSNENHGVFPRTIHVPGAGLVEGTNPAAPDPFKPGGPLANDTTAALFLLIRTQHLPAELFADPYNDSVEYVPDGAATPSRSNFSDYRNNLGYSYANPYPDASATTAGYRLSNRVSSAFALAADLNPGTGGKSNSKNHEGDGQNVLFADGHVDWETSPLCGIGGDNIYTTRTGAVKASPADALDNVLLPTSN